MIAIATIKSMGRVWLWQIGWDVNGLKGDKVYTEMVILEVCTIRELCALGEFTRASFLRS